MENKDDREFYCSMPKKALQELCKKYGLSPYKTKPNLVDSLNSYFKKKSSQSPPGSSSVSSSSQILQSQFGIQSTHKVDDKKESCGIIPGPINDDNSKYDFPSGQCNGQKSYTEADKDKVSRLTIYEDRGCPITDIQKISPLTNKVTETSGSVKIGVQQMQHQNMNNNVSLREGAFASSSGSSSAVPYFEYHVKSEEGINLYVDLNSSRAEWYKSLVNEFTMGQTVQENKFRSLREELGQLGNSNSLMNCSSLGITERVHGIVTGNVKVKSSGDSIMKRNGCEELTRDGVDGTSRFTTRETCSNVTEAFEHSEEGKEHLLFSSPNFSASDELNSDKSSSPREGGKALDSDVSGTTLMKMACTSDVRLTENDPEYLHKMEYQASKLGNGRGKNLILQEHSQFSETNSKEMQLPEIAIQKKDSIFPFMTETGDGDLAMGRKDCASGTESLECFNLNGSSKKSSVQSISDNGRKRKKRQEGRSQSSFSQSEGKILRSSKRLAREVVPRRSLRLIIK